jgi:hypothetical protein
MEQIIGADRFNSNMVKKCDQWFAFGRYGGYGGLHARVTQVVN